MEEDRKERIYNLMCGYYDLDTFSAKEGMLVKNEFEDGSDCQKLLEEIYVARLRLLERLNTEEDKDILEIVEGYEKLCRFLAYKMYEYGTLFAVINEE